jgi:hypothetical protein
MSATNTKSPIVPCIIHSKVFISSKAFRYFRKEIQNSVRHQILENEGKVDEDDRKEIEFSSIPSFCSEILLKFHLNGRKVMIDKMSAVFEGSEK